MPKPISPRRSATTASSEQTLPPSTQPARPTPSSRHPAETQHPGPADAAHRHTQAGLWAWNRPKNARKARAHAQPQAAAPSTHNPAITIIPASCRNPASWHSRCNAKTRASGLAGAGRVKSHSRSMRTTPRNLAASRWRGSDERRRTLLFARGFLTRSSNGSSDVPELTQIKSVPPARSRPRPSPRPSPPYRTNRREGNEPDGSVQSALWAVRRTTPGGVVRQWRRTTPGGVVRRWCRTTWAEACSRMTARPWPTARRPTARPPRRQRRRRSTTASSPCPGVRGEL